MTSKTIWAVIAIAFLAAMLVLAVNPPEGQNEYIGILGPTNVCFGTESSYTCTNSEGSWGNAVSYIWVVDGGTVVEGGGINDDFVSVNWNISAGDDKLVQVTHNSNAKSGPNQTGPVIPDYNGQKASLPVTVLKVDVEPTVLNTSHDATSASLNLTSDSFLGDGTANWTSEPPGISGAGSTITFNPSGLTPTNYAVEAKSSLLSSCMDNCQVNVFKVEIKAEGGELNPANAIPATGVEKYKAVVTPALSGTYVWFSDSTKMNLTPSGENVAVNAGAEPSLSVGAEDLNVRFTPTATMSSCWDTRRLTVFTVDLKSVIFASYNAFLRNYNSDFSGDGTVEQRYNPYGWIKGGANNPISHTGDMNVTINETVCAKPAGVQIYIQGLSETPGLSFASVWFVSAGVDQTFSLVSQDKLLPKVNILSDTTEWKVNGGGTCWVSVGQSGPHKLYVTRGIPMGSLPTEKRINYVCSKASGLWDQSDCADAIWNAVPSGPGHFGVPVSASGWGLIDGGQAECLGLADCMTFVVRMLGINAETKKVCASTDGGVGNCLDVETRENCASDHGPEVLSLLFDIANAWEGCCSAAGHYYALYPFKRATDDYAMLKKLVPSEAQQYWFRKNFYGYPYGDSCTVPPGEIPVP